jgi:hypothetical protein
MKSVNCSSRQTFKSEKYDVVYWCGLETMHFAEHIPFETFIQRPKFPK